MAILSDFGLLSLVALVGCIGMAFGWRMLGWLGVSSGDVLEDGTLAAGAFFATFQMLLLALGLCGWMRMPVVLSLLGIAALIAGKAWGRLADLAGELVQIVRSAARSRVVLTLVGLTLLCLILDGFLAMAPLTGSDAELYHFTAPLLELGKRWQPVFWLAMSFYFGLGHSLIQMGMALGSDRLSMGFIWLAGVLTTASLFVLTRRLAGERWAWLSAAAFLLTPIVYWQIGVSGCPDIWMCFYITLAVLAAARGVETSSPRWWYFAGFLAGAAAGVKYTAWVVPAAVVLCCLLITRSLVRSFLCGVASLGSGSLPLLRNFWATGDPFFPYLTRWMAPAQFNPFAFKAILEDTHPAGFSRAPAALATYLMFPLKWEPYGDFGHLWGPLVLGFAPLLLLVVFKSPLSRLATILWMVVLLTNGMTVQQPRHLLPCYPLALALILAGMAEAVERRWRLLRVVVMGGMAGFLSFGLASEAWYAKDFLPVAVGVESREAFLERMAPDYPTVNFINHSLAGTHGKVMVFFQRGYYLQVPFEIGDPHVSWLMNPVTMGAPDSLLKFLHREGIQWVVETAYPEPFDAAFETLEDQGKLRPTFTADIPTFSGFRMYGQRTLARVVIYAVGPALSAGALPAAEKGFE